MQSGFDEVSGFERIFCGSGNDFVFGSTAAEQLFGRAGNDRLIGNAGNDKLDGGTGNDSLDGGAGNDFLIGGAGATIGADTLIGGGGDDVLYGDQDADLLTGGAGNDTFQFKFGSNFLSGITIVTDTITDFTKGEDELDFSAYDAIPSVAGIQDLVFIGTAAFSASGQVRFSTAAGTTTVSICENFATVPGGFAALSLTGTIALTAADFAF